MFHGTKPIAFDYRFGSFPEDAVKSCFGAAGGTGSLCLWDKRNRIVPPIRLPLAAGTGNQKTLPVLPVY